MGSKAPEKALQASLRQRVGAFMKGLVVLRLLVGVLVITNVVLLFLIFFSSKGIPGYRNQAAQVRELETKIARLKKENQKLFERIQSFKNDPLARERLIRQELGWVRDNELTVEFVQPDRDVPGR
ncbi:MAG: septum formation initiator family protein [Syntrophobacteraceae bacterium]|nr:septum formation initiator family protein [Syntrophobacteraceae bacterium]